MPTTLSFVCPACQRPLDSDNAQLHCHNATCHLSQTPFPHIDGTPVLIDFQASILQRDDVLASGGESHVARNHGKLKQWIKRSVFKPEAVQCATHNARTLLTELRRSHGGPYRVLVVGGGAGGPGTDLLAQDEQTELVTFDIYRSPQAMFVADAHSIPLPDQSVDAVWIQYVLEHVLEPQRVVNEIHRVLRPHGIVYAETPFLQQVHEGPYDFTRFTYSGHRWLFRNFAEIQAGTSMGLGLQCLWTLEHTVRSITRSKALGKLAKLSCFWLRYLDRISNTLNTRDTASSFYFLGRRSEQSLTPAEIVSYYQTSPRQVARAA